MSVPQVVGGQLGLFDYVYLDVTFEYVRPGQKAVVQASTSTREKCMLFFLMSSKPWPGFRAASPLSPGYFDVLRCFAVLCSAPSTCCDRLSRLLVA